MLRRPKLLSILILMGVLLAGLSFFVICLKSVPSFYCQHSAFADWDIRLKSASLLKRVQDLKNDIRSKADWGGSFDVDDLNCFFSKNMSPQGEWHSILPNQIHSPCVSIEGDKLRLGFRYGEGLWSAVVWVELRIWLVAEEINAVAIEISELRIGKLSIGSQSILDSVTESAHDSNIEVTWYRNGNNPVGIFRFFPDQLRPTSQIRTLEVKDGKIVIAGQTILNPAATISSSAAPE